MKRTSRFAFGTVFLLCVALAAWAGISLIGRWTVKNTVESVGTDTLGQNVSVASASLSLFGGELRLNNLNVANPPGYQNENIIHLDSGLAEIDMWSLLKETVRIRQMELDGAVLIIEQRGLHNNLHEVLQSLRNADSETHRDAFGKKLQIDILHVSNVRVRSVLNPIPGQAGTFELALAPIEMTNLGHDNPLSLPILVAKILQAIASGAAEKGLNILPREMIGQTGTSLRFGGENVAQGNAEAFVRFFDGIRYQLPVTNEE